jgi:hypothetical protein
VARLGAKKEKSVHREQGKRKTTHSPTLPSAKSASNPLSLQPDFSPLGSPLLHSIATVSVSTSSAVLSREIESLSLLTTPVETDGERISRASSGLIGESEEEESLRGFKPGKEAEVVESAGERREERRVEPCFSRSL